MVTPQFSFWAFGVFLTFRPLVSLQYWNLQPRHVTQSQFCNLE